MQLATIGVLPDQTATAVDAMPTVGCLADAELIAQHADTLANQPWTLDRGHPARAWKQVESGSYRHVFLAPDKTTVYKVTRFDESRILDMQEREAQNIANAWRRYPQFRAHIPATSLYKTSQRIHVVAMEFIGGPVDFDRELSYAVREAARQMDVQDVAPRNCRKRSDGTLVIIDWGGYR